MIEISGSVQKRFVFPGPTADAFTFFSKVARTVQYLRYIELDQHSTSAPDCYRLAYQTKEMGMYEVTVYSDVRAVAAADHSKFELVPLVADDGRQTGFPAVKGEFTPRAAVAQGTLHAKVAFAARPDGQTDVDYGFSMNSYFELPMAMRFMPVEPIKQVIQQMVSGRLDEVANEFIKKAIAAYERDGLQA